MERARRLLVRALALALSFFTLVEVNYPQLSPQSQLAIFALLGVALCFLRQRPEDGSRLLAAGDLALAALMMVVGAYVVVQTEPVFSPLWLGGEPLGGRAGIERPLDYVVGALGLILILEATRRSLGWTLPVLSLAFLAYGRLGYLLPDWLLPHRGYDWSRLVAQTFLHSQGVFGVALKVMFTYVFLFLVFGALLEATGSTQFVIEVSRRLFRGTSGGSAKVAVFSSGLMGSLSGSAVANTATTGTFTIPMMRSAGFQPYVAAGVEAAASSGGALVPPVMGAGAYMMLEIIDPPVTYVEIIRAALLPACLYYLSLLLIVHFQAQRVGQVRPEKGTDGLAPLGKYEGAIFGAALAGLIVFLLMGYTVFRAVTLSLGVILVLSLFHRDARLTPRRIREALITAAANAVPLVSAAACVGIIIGVVTLTGVGSRLPALILPLASEHLLFALILIMVSSIILGMGLPSAVCYLLMATLIGPVLSRLGVVTLAAHLFIFYFGMMSMVTPPVALAAYAASTIAGSGIMRSATAAFRFALVGFTLPYMFVFRPQLLMLDASGAPASAVRVVLAVLLAVLGIVPLAAGIAGYLWRPLGPASRLALFATAGLLLLPGGLKVVAEPNLSIMNLLGLVLLAATLVTLWRRRHGSGRQAAAAASRGSP